MESNQFSHNLEIQNTGKGVVELNLSIKMVASPAELMNIVEEMRQLNKQLFYNCGPHPAIVLGALFGADTGKLNELLAQLTVASAVEKINSNQGDR
jgi:hypothetical protein